MLARALVLSSLVSLSPLAAAQGPHVCEGNGLAPLSIAVSPAYLGGALQVDLGAPTAPGGVVLLAKATAVGPVFHPLIGWGCLDVFAPGLQLFTLPLDGAGAAHLSLPLPPNPALVGAPPLFLSPALPTPLGIALGKTVPIHFTFEDSWSPAGSLPVARGFLQATALGDGPEDDRIDVLLSGGGDVSIVEPGSKSETWIYHPLTRTFAAGPVMSVPRNFHTQTKLADGRVLILGGCDADGVCHASGEIYDHDTGQLTPIAPMSTPRSGHAATLLDDGRVLVTGGLADFRIAVLGYKPALDTVQASAEIYDPATDTWQPTGAMQVARAGHGQVRWHDGRVLVVMGMAGGILGGFDLEVASFTTACDWYDPASGAFSPAPPMPSGAFARGFFGLGFLGTGELVAAGGWFFNILFGNSSSSEVTAFDGAVWTSLNATPAPGAGFQAAAMPAVETLPDGRLLIAGGFAGTDDLRGTAVVVAGDEVPAGFGESYGVELADLGTGVGQPGLPSPRGGHAMVELFDGTFLVVGGMNGSTATLAGTWALADAWIYAP